MPHTGADSSPAWEGYVTTPDGHRLVFRDWQPPTPPRAALLIVHGYADHQGRYDHVAAHFVTHGYAVHTYDQRGHGHSSGRRTYVRSFDQYLDDLGLMLEAVQRQHSEVPVFLFGHSMGGAVVTLYALERAPEVAGLILTSPAITLPDNVAPLLQKLSWLVGTLLPWLPTIKLDINHLSRDPEVVAQAAKDPLYYRGRMPARTGAELLRTARRIEAHMETLTLPFFVCHGTADQLTDPNGSIALYNQAASQDKTLTLYPGFYHETFNEPEGQQVLNQITAWLEEHVHT